MEQPTYICKALLDKMRCLKLWVKYNVLRLCERSPDVLEEQKDRDPPAGRTQDWSEMSWLTFSNVVASRTEHWSSERWAAQPQLYK